MNQGILGLAMGFAGGASAPLMQTPSGLSASYFDSGFDISTTISWDAPAIAPDTYDFIYDSTAIGPFNLILSGSSVQETIIGESYDTAWDVSLIAQKSGYTDSIPATIDGTTPSAP
jgi:hypothetical protein